jgi:AAA15 family ATPase/GTPase
MRGNIMSKGLTQVARTPKEIGVANKDIKVKKIQGINFKNFRTMKDSVIELADRITLISGHNGTMKSTLIGLFVQPFISNSEDIFGNPLKTPFREIFKLSPEYDKEKYEYDVLIKDNNELDYRIPVYTKPRSKDDPRIRIVTGGASKSDGNLIFNTNYLNLNRLYSIHTSNASPHFIDLSEKEKQFVSDFYNAILQKSNYASMETVIGSSSKKTFGPTEGKYNFESISSGEDNLGRIASSLLSFMRVYKDSNVSGCYNGLLCIDEIEASLHPVAQINLFDFLYKWANKYKVQILVNTHSLPLIRHSILVSRQKEEINTYYLSTLYSENIQVISNPSYESIYKELTFEFDGASTSSDLPKIDVICEDKLAIKFLKYVISKQSILKRINFIHPDEGEGFPYKFLIKLCNSASSFLSNTIVIFDADVSDEAINKIKKQDNILRIPDTKLKLPIEKLLVKYLYEKPLDDDIYIKTLKMPKNAFLRSLTNANINIRTTQDIHKIKSKLFKDWYSTNENIVKKVFNTFAKEVSGRQEFIFELTEKLNKINVKNGYPSI